ncbi:hypothetical protein KXD40_000855 [Peronospora effusa]|uniref:Crinkler effector protein N-terminal domain-containing protein n=1 Tax=Peronospora effusa TaxID=542832 RepID=A0A3M6VF89_9STRA|nr:hypothetical protein DD238_004038 [Peronospora effusa]RQM14475.1 hypothetical protein DD237_004757 [Peronospora effusa]UIZ20675.1 hypothetical protein KXD40_000855 [Peronospora effusa]
MYHLLVPVSVTYNLSNSFTNNIYVVFSRSFENLPTKKEIETCAIVGVSGSVFSDRLHNNDFEKVIKAKNPRKITCDASDLQLFPTKIVEGSFVTTL